MLVIFFLKSEPPQLHSKIELPWGKDLITGLRKNSSKLNILDLIDNSGIIKFYINRWACLHWWWWKIPGTLMSSRLLFRKKILDIGSLNILESMISRAMKYRCQYMKLIASFRLSWRKTAAFLRLYSFIIKIYTLEKWEMSDKLWLRWCVFFTEKFFRI